MNKCLNQNRGFSLVELLLSVALCSLISLSVYQILYLGAKLIRQSCYDNSINHKIRLLLNLMERDLLNIALYEISNSYPEKKIFEGKEDQLTFAEAKEDGIKMIRYFIEKKGSSNSNVIREEMDFFTFLELGSDPDSQKKILVKNLQNAQLKFLYSDRELPFWDQNAFPSHIQIQITFTKENEKKEISNHVFIPTASYAQAMSAQNKT